MSAEFNKVTSLVASQLKQAERRVLKTDQHDWNKLKHTSQILKQKLNLLEVLIPLIKNLMKWNK